MSRLPGRSGLGRPEITELFLLHSPFALCAPTSRPTIGAFPRAASAVGFWGRRLPPVQMVGFRLFSTFSPILGASAILVRPFCRCPLAVSLSCGHCSDKAVEPLYTPLGLGIASTPSPSCLSSRKVTLLRSLPLTTWKRGQARCQLRMSLLPSAASRLGGTTRPSQHHQRRQHSSPFPRDGASPWC